MTNNPRGFILSRKGIQMDELRKDETTLRVIQALEIQPSFQYVLNMAQVERLRTVGYTVKIVKEMNFCLVDAIVQRNDDHGPESYLCNTD